MLLINLNRALFAAFAACAFLVPGNAAANPLMSPESPSDIASNANEWAELRRRIDALETQIQFSKDSPSVFNPAITVFGNAMGCFSRGAPESEHEHDHEHEHEEGEDHHHHVHEHEHSHVDCPNQFWLREVELDLRASIDPYADGVVILAFEQEKPGEFHFEVEEAYAVLKPGFELKLGRFRSSFGRINRIHTHDLPQIVMPRSVKNFLGDHGLIQDGASAQFLLPTPGEQNALTLNLETLFGKKLPIGDDNNAWPKFSGRLSWFFDLSEGHDIDVGASTLIQPRDLEQRPFQLYGADFNYRWRPYVLGDKKSFLIGGEMFIGNDTKSFHNALPIGGFAWTQVQFNQNAYLGFRYSYDQGVTEANLLNTSAGVFLTCYTTEFLRFRVGYDRVSNDMVLKEGRDLFMVELNFIYGSHPVEPYWVNR